MPTERLVMPPRAHSCDTNPISLPEIAVVQFISTHHVRCSIPAFDMTFNLYGDPEAPGYLVLLFWPTSDKENRRTRLSGP
jgi:hypothetical protein